MVTRRELTALFECFPYLRIAVVGDLFLDKWLTIDPTLNEPSVETGLAAWQVVDIHAAAGAAGTVLNNLSALGVGMLYAISLIGMDGEGFEIKRALIEKRVDLSMLVESDKVRTPAYIKPLILQADGTRAEQNRMDHKNRKQTPKEIENALISGMEQAAEKVDAIILLDQLAEENTGVVTQAVRKAAARLANKHPNLIIYADSRAFIGKFENMIIKCNNHEAAALSGMAAEAVFSTEEVFKALAVLSKQTARPVFVTCNEYGVAINFEGKPALVAAAKQTDEIDICGAGDACTAGIVSALCAKADVKTAALLGNLCAGVTVRKLGVTGDATRQEVLALYDEQFS